MREKKKRLRQYYIFVLMTGILILGLTGSVQAAAPKLTAAKKTLVVGKTCTLSLKNNTKTVKWSNSQKSVVTMKKLKNNSVKLTAKKKGTAVITAKAGKKTYKCRITVKESPKLNKTGLTLTVGKTYDLKVTGTASAAKWSTSKKAVAAISRRSKYVYRVKAVKAGTADIKVKINGKTYKCRVTVKSAGISSAKVNRWYSEFMQKSSTVLPDGYILNLQNTYFAVVDINKDGVKELIVKQSAGAAYPGMTSAGRYVFTIYKNRVKFAGCVTTKQDNITSTYIYPSYGMISEWYTTASDRMDNFYVLQNGELKRKIELYRTWNSGNGQYLPATSDPLCYKNGVKISKAEYDRLNQKYDADKKLVELIPNTAANRKAVFGS